MQPGEYSIQVRPRARRSDWFAYVLIVIFVAFFVGVAVGRESVSEKPNCPTEDSCSVDYRNGEWHITEVSQ